MTIVDACNAYLRDLEARNIRKATREGYESLFRQLEAFAREAGIESLDGFDRDALRRWREQWTVAPSTQRKHLGQLKAFFAFLQTERCITESPVTGVRPPREDIRPTMPLSPEEMQALLAAAESKPKERALLLLLRYSGLAIRDGALLTRDAVKVNGDLVLRRAKSGELVTVALPAEVIDALEASAEPGRRHYFWTGRSEPASAAKLWRERLKVVAVEAKVEGFHPHRLRDTFAVELLLAGVMIQDVSTLLGHRSVSTTERHYAPWNLARRQRLELIVREVHRQDPILLEFISMEARKRIASEAVPKLARLALGRAG